MMRRYGFALVLGLAGVAILLALGVWQVRRLAWKEAVIGAIEAKIAAAPVALGDPGALDPGRDRYRAVSIEGRSTGEERLVLSGQKGIGPGYEVIAAFETVSGARILLDRGFVGEAARDAPRPAVSLRVTGNLHWPDEADRYTPPPDQRTGLWFARDVAGLAASLGTVPVMVVAREVAGDAQGIAPVPVGTGTIANDHLEYAVTWFSLAAVWAGMTGFLLWRIRQRTD